MGGDLFDPIEVLDVYKLLIALDEQRWKQWFSRTESMWIGSMSLSLEKSETS